MPDVLPSLPLWGCSVAIFGIPIGIFLWGTPNVKKKSRGFPLVSRLLWEALRSHFFALPPEFVVGHPLAILCYRFVIQNAQSYLPPRRHARSAVNPPREDDTVSDHSWRVREIRTTHALRTMHYAMQYAMHALRTMHCASSNESQDSPK